MSNPFILIDVNGLKKPNIFGRDVFLFYANVEKAKVEPFYDESDGACSYTGWNCAKDIIDAGWKMNY